MRTPKPEDEHSTVIVDDDPEPVECDLEDDEDKEHHPRTDYRLDTKCVMNAQEVKQFKALERIFMVKLSQLVRT